MFGSGQHRKGAHRDCVFHSLCFYMVAFTPINPHLGKIVTIKMDNNTFNVRKQNKTVINSRGQRRRLI